MLHSSALCLVSRGAVIQVLQVMVLLHTPALSPSGAGSPSEAPAPEGQGAAGKQPGSQQPSVRLRGTQPSLSHRQQLQPETQKHMRHGQPDSPL